MQGSRGTWARRLIATASLHAAFSVNFFVFCKISRLCICRGCPARGQCCSRCHDVAPRSLILCSPATGATLMNRDHARHEAGTTPTASRCWWVSGACVPLDWQRHSLRQRDASQLRIGGDQQAPCSLARWLAGELYTGPAYAGAVLFRLKRSMKASRSARSVLEIANAHSFWPHCRLSMMMLPDALTVFSAPPWPALPHALQRASPAVRNYLRGMRTRRSVRRCE
jgi:hypothetical protein